MKLQIVLDGALRTLVLDPAGPAGSFAGTLDGEPVAFSATLAMPAVAALVIHGRVYRCVLDRTDAAESGKRVSIGSRTFSYQVHDPRSLATRRKRAHANEGTLLLKANMAGRVVRVLAEAGTAVAAHAGVIVIEAMKMQNELRSPRAGRVVELHVAAGEMVSAGQVLAVIE